ncbi:protein boule-like [Xenia sp. Carnegie-2017]|uniref:protein boule-like n=1 Tax=Xenia sp. Carnegie-2017 TaxID=2897299 RepID=UPI001F039F1E|nr:protein boule-like [Xenia sp. Carnegie-2017]
MAEIQTYLYGKKFPNRIFVGGFPLNTSAVELAEFFRAFGHVTEAKIILDHSGLSKGYGFVTFETKSTVKIIENIGVIYFKNKKINIGPAVRKEASFVQPELVYWPQNSYIPQQTQCCMGYSPVMDPVYWNCYANQPFPNASNIPAEAQTPRMVRSHRAKTDVPPRFQKYRF